MLTLLPEIIASRKNVTFAVARWMCISGYKLLTRPHVEMHPDVERLGKGPGTVFFYAGLHKSLWETTGIQVSLVQRKMQLPYAGMGDNLIRGKFFQRLAKKTGVFLIKRAGNRSEMLESARQLKQYVMTFLAHGWSLMLFPEGTRKNIPSQGSYGKFFPSAFEGLLEYEKQKDKILVQYPHLTPADSYIIPFNVDYSKIREDAEMLADNKGKPRTLHITDSLSMIKNIGDTYISFGKPIKMADHIDKDRKALAVFTRERCLELVKVLPINVAAHATVEAMNQAPAGVQEISQADIIPFISSTLEKLAAYKERFREFSFQDNPQEILKKVAKYEAKFKRFKTKNLDFYQLYANYIRHYF